MQLEFAVLCDYAGHLANGRFVVVEPALNFVSVDAPPIPSSVSLAAGVRLLPEDEGQHRFRVDATSPAKGRFTVTSELPFPVEAKSTAICNLAVRVSAAFDSPGDYLLHLVIDDEDVKTLPLHVFQASHANGEVRGPSLAEIEGMRQAELTEWIELEKATPSEELLRQISKRFSPPAEWFQEQDLFEPESS